MISNLSYICTDPHISLCGLCWIESSQQGQYCNMDPYTIFWPIRGTCPCVGFVGLIGKRSMLHLRQNAEYIPLWNSARHPSSRIESSQRGQCCIITTAVSRIHTQKPPLYILSRNNDLWTSALPQISAASQHKYEDAADKDCAFCLTNGVSAHSVALHVQLYG